MRRLLAISLLMLFAVPFALPVLGMSAAEANLPLCCRRGGKHQCAAMNIEGPDGSARTVSEKCPYSTAQPAILVLPSAPPLAASIFAGVTRHPSVAPQTEAHRRISFSRARQKRGPPSHFS